MMFDAPRVGIWDTILAALPFGWRRPVFCRDCCRELQGPAVFLGGGYMERRHFEDRCIPCEMIRAYKKSMERLRKDFADAVSEAKRDADAYGAQFRVLRAPPARKD